MSESKTQLIYSKISLIMDEMEAVPKSKEMTQGASYKYRGIEQIKNASNPLFSKHKVFYSPKVLEHKIEQKTSNAGKPMLHHVVKVQYTLFAEDGSKVECEVYGEAMDSGDKGVGKAQSYAEKVMLIQILNIPTEEQKDPDDENPQLGSAKANTKPPQATKPPPAAPKPQENPNIISEAQLKRLMTIATSVGWKDQEVKDFLKSKGYKSRKDILKKDYNAIVDQIQNPPQGPEPVSDPVSLDAEEEIPF